MRRHLLAPNASTWEANLRELESWEDFQLSILPEHLASLRSKQVSLSLRLTDSNLAPTSNSSDRIVKRLERKFSSMTQFRSHAIGRATLNGWGIVYDFRRSGADARQQGKSPAELAGVEFNGLLWLQFILIQLSKVRWLKPFATQLHNLCEL